MVGNQIAAVTQEISNLKSKQEEHNLKIASFGRSVDLIKAQPGNYGADT